MSGHAYGILKYFHSITHNKDAPKDKDPPEGKELPNLSRPYIKGYTPHHHCDQLPTVTLM